jgi:hypothetical protein
MSGWCYGSMEWRARRGLYFKPQDENEPFSLHPFPGIVQKVMSNLKIKMMLLAIKVQQLFFRHFPVGSIVQFYP